MAVPSLHAAPHLLRAGRRECQQGRLNGATKRRGNDERGLMSVNLVIYFPDGLLSLSETREISSDKYISRVHIPVRRLLPLERIFNQVFSGTEVAKGRYILSVCTCRHSFTPEFSHVLRAQGAALKREPKKESLTGATGGPTCNEKNGICRNASDVAHEFSSLGFTSAVTSSA